MKKSMESMKDRVVALATMGYLAAIFYGQGDEDTALNVLEQMSIALSADNEVAKALDPFLVQVAKRIGFDVKFLETAETDRGMH